MTFRSSGIRLIVVRVSWSRRRRRARLRRRAAALAVQSRTTSNFGWAQLVPRGEAEDLAVFGLELLEGVEHCGGRRFRAIVNQMFAR